MHNKKIAQTKFLWKSYKNSMFAKKKIPTNNKNLYSQLANCNYAYFDHFLFFNYFMVKTFKTYITIKILVLCQFWNNVSYRVFVGNNKRNSKYVVFVS